jgi:hypothetical protein
VSTIQQLTEQETVQSSDQFPIYSSTNGQPRRVSANALLTYVQDNLTSDSAGPFTLSSYTVAELATDYPASQYMNAVVYCVNGDTGSPCLAVSDGTNWRRVVFGAAVAT